MKKPTKSLKEINVENKKTVKFYINLYLLTIICSASIRFFYHYNSLNLNLILIYTFIFVVDLIALLLLKYMANDGFTDINISDGLAEHLKDIIIYTTVVVTSASILSDRFLLLYTLVPCRIMYLFWVHVISRYWTYKQQALSEQNVPTQFVQRKSSRKQK